MIQVLTYSPWVSYAIMHKEWNFFGPEETRDTKKEAGGNILTRKEIPLVSMGLHNGAAAIHSLPLAEKKKRGSIWSATNKRTA